jgi:hypothetical protein
LGRGRLRWRERLGTTTTFDDCRRSRDVGTCLAVAEQRFQAACSRVERLPQHGFDLLLLPLLLLQLLFHMRKPCAQLRGLVGELGKLRRIGVDRRFFAAERQRANAHEAQAHAPRDVLHVDTTQAVPRT